MNRSKLGEMPFRALSLIFLTLSSCFLVRAQTWTTKLDDSVRFYQATDVGAVVVGTKKSLYAVDAMTGDILWRRKESTLDENDVAPIQIGRASCRERV